MASNSYRCNLSAKTFPLLARNQSRSVIYAGDDQPYTRWGSVPERMRDVNTPQGFYMHNVLPTIEGYKSVGYKAQVAVTTPGAANVIKAKELFYNGTQYAIAELANGTFSALGSGPSIGVANLVTAALTGNTCTNYDETAVSYATVNGQTYVLMHDSASAGTNFSKFQGTTMLNTATTGLTLANVIGIVGANGYNIAFTVNAVAWSSLVDPTDFIPSLITGAGGGSIQEAKGYIKFCVATSFGFIVYCERNAVAAVYTGNARNPFKFTEIKGSGGGVSPELVVRDVGGQYNIAWTTKGLQKLGPVTADSVYPELEDLIYTKTKEQYSSVSHSLVNTAVSSRLGRLALMCNRWLVYSFNATSSDASNSNYSDAIVYDMTLERYGRLQLSHAHCLEFGAYYPQAANGSFNLPFQEFAPPIFLIQQNGQVYQFGERFGSFSAGESLILLGKFEYIREKRICVDQVLIENSGQNFDSSNINCTVIPIQDNSVDEVPVVGYRFINRSNFVQFNFRVDGNSHMIEITGPFNLTNVQFKFHVTGNS